MEKNNKQIVLGSTFPISDPDLVNLQSFEWKHFPSINDLGLTYSNSKVVPCICGKGNKIKSTYLYEQKDQHVLEYFLCSSCDKASRTLGDVLKYDNN